MLIDLPNYLYLFTFTHLRFKNDNSMPQTKSVYINLFKEFFSNPYIKTLFNPLNEQYLREVIRIWENNYSISKGDISILLLFLMNCNIDITKIISPLDLSELAPGFNTLHDEVYYIEESKE